MRVARAESFACALAAVSAPALVAQAPPPAPDGFSWKSIESVKASFLTPTGWHFREEDHDGARAFFITQEEIVDGGQYETGLSVNVQKLKKDPAPERAAQFIAALMAANEALDSWKRQQGALEAFGCRVRISGEGSAAARRTGPGDRQPTDQHPLHPDLREPREEVAGGVGEGRSDAEGVPPRRRGLTRGISDPAPGPHPSRDPSAAPGSARGTRRPRRRTWRG